MSIKCALFAGFVQLVLANVLPSKSQSVKYFHLKGIHSPYNDTNGRLLTDYNITSVSYEGQNIYSSYDNYTVVFSRTEAIGNGHEFDTNKPLILAQDKQGHLYRVDSTHPTNQSKQITVNNFGLTFGAGPELVCNPVKAQELLECRIAGDPEQNFFYATDNACDILQVDYSPDDIDLGNGNAGSLGVNQCQDFEMVNFTVVPTSLGYAPPAYNCEKPTKTLPTPASVSATTSKGFHLFVNSSMYGSTGVLQIGDNSDESIGVFDGMLTYHGRFIDPPTLAVEPLTGRLFDPIAFGKSPTYLAAGDPGSIAPSALSMQKPPSSNSSGPSFITCQPFVDGKVVNCTLEGAKKSNATFWTSGPYCEYPFVYFQSTQPSISDFPGCDYVEATIRAVAAPLPAPRPQWRPFASFTDKSIPMNGTPLFTPLEIATPLSFENNITGPGRVYASRIPSEQGFAAYDPVSDPSVIFTKTLKGTQQFVSCSLDSASNLQCGGKYILDWYCPINPLTGLTPILGCPLNWQTGFAKCDVQMQTLDHWYPVGWFQVSAIGF